MFRHTQNQGINTQLLTRFVFPFELHVENAFYLHDVLFRKRPIQPNWSLAAHLRLPVNANGIELACRRNQPPSFHCSFCRCLIFTLPYLLVTRFFKPPSIQVAFSCEVVISQPHVSGKSGPGGATGVGSKFLGKY
jgi:hypothetical protein